MNFFISIKYVFCLFVLTTTVASYGMDTHFSNTEKWNKKDITKNKLWIWYTREKGKKEEPRWGPSWLEEKRSSIGTNPQKLTLTIKTMAEKLPRTIRLPKKEYKELFKKICDNSLFYKKGFDEALSYISQQQNKLKREEGQGPDKKVSSN